MRILQDFHLLFRRENITLNNWVRWKLIKNVKKLFTLRNCCISKKKIQSQFQPNFPGIFWRCKTCPVSLFTPRKWCFLLLRKLKKRLQGKMFLYAVTQRYFKDQNFLIIVLFQRWISKNIWGNIYKEQTGHQVLSPFFESWVNTIVIKLGHYWPQQKREHFLPRER